MKIGFYPGCSLEGASREYNESVLALAKQFEIELVQIPDWNCCGATAAHNLNKELSLSLPARILSLASNEGITEILVPCAACYSRLSVTKHELTEEPALKGKIAEITGMDFDSKIEILNIIQFIEKYIVDKIQYKLFQSFNHKVACYYGCLLVRPNNILKFDRAEDPQTMDVVMEKLGAEPIDWAFKTECCGAGLSVSKTGIVAKLSGNIIEDAVDRGAEVIIVAWPMCHSNLDMRRNEINEMMKQKYDIPVIFITQAIGFATGIEERELGMQRHFVPVELKKGVPVKAELMVEPQSKEEN